GGGIWSGGANATLTILNSTISGNSAGASGGGIDSSGQSLSLTHVTITNNTAATFAGGVSFAGAATIGNSIVTGNTATNAPNDVSPGATLLGNNLLAGDPMLGPLNDNGGPTFTHMPKPGSPALDAGDNTVAINAGLTTDQRGAGFARILDSADADTTQTVDIG